MEAEDGAVEEVVEEVEEVEEVEAEAVVGAVEDKATVLLHRLPSGQVYQDDVEVDVEGIVFSTKPRCSNSWKKSSKINNKRPRGVASQASRPPTPSPPPIKTTVVPP